MVVSVRADDQVCFITDSVGLTVSAKKSIKSEYKTCWSLHKTAKHWLVTAIRRQPMAGVAANIDVGTLRDPLVG